MNEDKKKNTKLYRSMFELGKEQFYIELIEEYKCENQQQLRKKEGEYIRSYKSELNQIVAGRTKAEHSKENRVELRKKEVIYEELTKDKIAERKRQYYQENKERIAEVEKKYREANKEKIREREKKYSEANRDKINARNRERRREIKKLWENKIL